MMSRLTISELWDAYCGEENSELLEQARSLWGGAGLAILSNSGDGAREEEECRFMLSSIFEPICYSHERGVAKPDAGAYRNALTLMCANAGDVLFIDGHDRAVQGALNRGIHAILHRDNDTTITAIEVFIDE